MTQSAAQESWSTRVRRVFARGISLTGLGGLAERARPVALTILTYHRVLPREAAMAYPFGGMTMPLDQFEAQMAHLAARYEPREMGEALRLLASGELSPRSIVVTFDDGYRDNYVHAFPVLQRHRIPATVFVVTGALDGTARLWWDDVADLASALSKLPRGTEADMPSLPGRWGSFLAARVGTADGRSFAQDLVTALNAAPRAERLRIIAALRKRAGPATERANTAILTWEEARTMHRSGFTIGAHTVTHAFLDELSEDEAREEIERSVARVGETIGEPARYFSYPRGRVSARAKRLLAAAGIEAAVTTRPGRNSRGADFLALRRVDAGHLRVRTGFDPAIFEAELQGWFQAFRRGA